MHKIGSRNIKVCRKFTDEEFIENALKCGVFAFDVEHEMGIEFNNPDFIDKFWGIGLSTWNDEGEICAAFYTDLSGAEKIMQKLFPEIESIAYNGKYDMKCVKALGFDLDYPANIIDPMVAVNLLDDNRRPNMIGLKKVVKDYYGYEMAIFKEASKAGKDSEEFEKYAIDDVIWELQLWRDLKPRIFKEKLDNLFYKILMPVSKVFADMEYVGMKWDCSKAREILMKFASMRTEFEFEIKSEIGELNLNSGNQLAVRLFDELGYSTRGIDMTKSGARYSTDVKAMSKLAKKYPVCDKIVKYRTCDKMIGTYVEPLTRRAMDDPFSRIHPTFWLVSSTGRTRCEKPNLQNLPAFLHDMFEGASLRKCFVPNEGRKLIVADLSQIELRVAAHISQDPMFMKAYCGWSCKECGEKGMYSKEILHSCPKCGAPENEKEGFWHGLDLHSMTAENLPALKGNRQAGKQANFALIYMATARRMHDTYSDMTIGEWSDALDQFMETYKGIKKWHLKCEHSMKAGGVSVDIFGRKRRIPKFEISKSYKHSLNQFVNFPVQSSACAYIELALVKLREELLEQGRWMSSVVPINFVHDEIVLEVDESQVEDVSKIVLNHLENVVKLRVPVRADLMVVDSWGDAK